MRTRIKKEEPMMVCNSTDHKATSKAFMAICVERGVKPFESRVREKRYYLHAFGLKKEISAYEAKQYPSEFVTVE